MPYLNWKGESDRDFAKPTIESDSDGRFHTIQLEIATSHARQLAQLLEEAASELRLELIDGFTVFIKSREGDSRLLLAHPEQNEWVATLALEKQVLVEVIEHLKTKTETFKLSEKVPHSKMNNLDFHFLLK